MEGSGLQETSAEGGPGQLQCSSGVHAMRAAMAAAEGGVVLPKNSGCICSCHLAGALSASWRAAAAPMK